MTYDRDQIVLLLILRQRLKLPFNYAHFQYQSKQMTQLHITPTGTCRVLIDRSSALHHARLWAERFCRRDWTAARLSCITVRGDAVRRWPFVAVGGPPPAPGRLWGSVSHPRTEWSAVSLTEGVGSPSAYVLWSVLPAARTETALMIDVGGSCYIQVMHIGTLMLWLIMDATQARISKMQCQVDIYMPFSKIRVKSFRSIRLCSSSLEH